MGQLLHHIRQDHFPQAPGVDSMGEPLATDLWGGVRVIQVLRHGCPPGQESRGEEGEAERFFMVRGHPLESLFLVPLFWLGQPDGWMPVQEWQKMGQAGEACFFLVSWPEFGLHWLFETLCW